MSLDNFDLQSDISIMVWAAPLGNFVLGFSELGGTDVLAEPEFADFDISCEIASIDITRGSSIESGLFTRPESGTCTMVLKTKEHDPFASGFIHLGSAMEILATIDEFGNKSTLFAGRVDSVDLSYNPDGSTSFTLMLSDSMKQLMNAVLDEPFDLETNAGHPAPFDAWEALDVIIGSSGTGFSFAGEDVSLTNIPNISEENLNVGAVINEISDAELGFFYWDVTDAALVGLPRNFADNLTPTLTMSNIHSTDPNHLCMASIDLGFAQDSIINKVVASLSWDATTTAIARNQDMIDLSGEQATEVALNLYAEADLTQWVQDLTLRSPVRVVRSVSGNAIDRANKMTPLTRIDVATPITVQFERDLVSIDQDYMVTRVDHSITPDGWSTTLELWRGN